jgi:Coenzyme PQQ synthesis protein D (PqqD)
MYRVSKGVRSTRGQDGAVVLDIRQGRIFSLNSMGSRMLALLSAGRIEQEIAAELSGEYGVSMETVESDLAEFIRALAGRALLEKG